ncbi:MAG: hypothetical protein ABSF82_14350 [Candidatus Bathyarchaeia archaeon]
MRGTSNEAMSMPKRSFPSRRIVPIVLMLTVVFASQLAAAYASPFQVNAGPPSPIYRTDFENVTLKYPEPHNDNGLNMGIPNSLVYGNYVQPGGATAWMEGLDKKTPGFTCHSGTRCLGMELFNITKSRRDEFNIENLNALTGDQAFVSVWLYLPANWQTYTPSGSSWYELVNPYFTSSGSYSAIYIIQTPPSHNFELQVAYQDANNVEHWLYDNLNFPLPVGRWFQVQYYVLKSSTNGILRIWFDGQLITDRSGLQNVTMGSAEKWSTTPAKIYYSTNDMFSPYRIWVDDLEIWKTQPQTSSSTSSSTTSTTTTQPAIPGFPWESILVGATIGLGALAVMRRRKNLTPSYRFPFNPPLNPSFSRKHC